MKKNFILLLVLSGAMGVVGCAKKKVEKRLDINPPNSYSSTIKNSENTTINRGYENVDRFGGLNNNRGYSYDNNRGYRDSRGYYSADDEYGNPNGLKNIYFAIDK